MEYWQEELKKFLRLESNPFDDIINPFNDRLVKKIFTSSSFRYGVVDYLNVILERKGQDCFKSITFKNTELPSLVRIIRSRLRIFSLKRR